MILVIPSIELKDGRCVFSICGEQGTENYYDELSSEPYELCKLLRKENAKAIHIYDADSFVRPENNNLSTITYFIQSTDIPFQAHSNFQNIDECHNLLDLGVYRVVLDSISILREHQVAELIREYTASRVIFNIPVIGNKVYFKNLNYSTDLESHLEYILTLGAKRIMYYEIDNNADKPFIYQDNIKLINNFNLKTTLSNDFTQITDLWDLKNYENLGIDSIIIGKSFYENRFSCQKIWRTIEAKLEHSPKN